MRTSLRVGLVAAVAAGVLVGQTGAWGEALPPGSVDTSFGSHGVAALPKSNHDTTGRPPIGLSMAIRSGRIWVSGAQGAQDYAMRLTSTGHADPTFRSGRPYFVVGGGWDAQDVLVLPSSDGGAYVVTDIAEPDGPDYHITKLTKSGSRDASWGVHGRSLVPIGYGCSECQGQLLAGTVLANGALRFAAALDVTAGDHHQTPVIAGLTASGAPDLSVGPGGASRVVGALLPEADTALRDATFDPTGRAYFLSAPPNNQKNSTLYPLVVRSSANGVLDTAWGYKGSAVIPLGGANVFAHGPKSTALLASSSGELYVGVDEAIPGLTKIKAAVAHLRPTGVVDRTFGYRGIARYSAVGANGSISAIASDGAGHLILGLTYSSATTFSHLLLRVSAKTGAVSTNFGHNGAVASPVFVLRMARQSAHRLVVLGWPTHSRDNNRRSGAGSKLVRYAI